MNRHLDRRRCSLLGIVFLVFLVPGMIGCYTVSGPASESSSADELTEFLEANPDIANEEYPDEDS